MLGTLSAPLPDCRPLLADPDDLTLVFQPIVDLAGARVAGYAALARFPGTSGANAWFAAAAEAGMAAELEAVALLKALAVVPALPPNTFLTVDVRPHLLGQPAVQAALATRSDLARVVVELSERTPVDDLASLRRRAQDLRSRGAGISLRDAGTGRSGLQRLAGLRPQLVALDRALVGAAGEPGRMTPAETVAEFAGRIDARLLAQDVETTAELAAVLRLGARLGRGWLLGRPSTEFAPLEPEVVRLITAQAARVRLAESVAGLLRPVRQYEDLDSFVEPPPAVLVGAYGEPLALLLEDARTGATYRAPVSLRVDPSSDVGQTLRRALSRPPAQRSDPVVCTDSTGAVRGLLRVEDLIRQTRRSGPAAVRR